MNQVSSKNAKTGMNAGLYIVDAGKPAIKDLGLAEMLVALITSAVVQPAAGFMDLKMEGNALLITYLSLKFSDRVTFCHHNFHNLV